LEIPPNENSSIDEVSAIWDSIYKKNIIQQYKLKIVLSDEVKELVKEMSSE